jgi:hypothetical protein
LRWVNDGNQAPETPRDPLQLAKLIGDIATGQVEDRVEQDPALEVARKGGTKGGNARAKALIPKQRAEIARLAAEARWRNPKPRHPHPHRRMLCGFRCPWSGPSEAESALCRH